VLQVLPGGDSGWPAAARDDGSLPFIACLKATWLMALAGAAALIFAWELTPDLFWWLAPVSVPLVLAPGLLYVTALPAIGRLSRKAGLLLTPYEVERVRLIRDMRLAMEVGSEPVPHVGSVAVV